MSSVVVCVCDDRAVLALSLYYSKRALLSAKSGLPRDLTQSTTICNGRTVGQRASAEGARTRTNNLDPRLISRRSYRARDHTPKCLTSHASVAEHIHTPAPERREGGPLRRRTYD